MAMNIIDAKKDPKNGLLSKIKIGDVVYELKDLIARESLEALSAEVDAILEVIGELPQDTIPEVIADLEKKIADALAAAKKYTDEEVAKEAAIARAAEKANADAIAATNEVVAQHTKDISDINAVLNTVSDEDNITSLKELASWVETHGGEAAAMSEAITANTEAIAQEAKDRADADKALGERIDDVEALLGEDGSVDTKIADALDEAKGYTDDEIGKLGDLAKKNLTELDLKALAHKDSATGTVTGVVTGVKDHTYTPAGSVSVTVNTTPTPVASNGTFTPVGNVTGTNVAAGTVTIARDENGVAITGTVSAPSVTVTPNTTSVQHINSLGELPSYSGAQYKAPSVNEGKAKFATTGLVAAPDAEDKEMLVFSVATTEDALVSTGFDAGSYTEGEFNAGKLPTFGDAITVVTGIKAAEATAPVFTGDKFGAAFAGTETAINAAFAGTEGTVAVTGNYDKATGATGAFEGTVATLTHEVETGDKTVTVQ